MVSILIILLYFFSGSLFILGFFGILRQLPKRQKKTKNKKELGPSVYSSLEEMFIFISPEQYLYLKISGILVTFLVIWAVGKNIYIALFGGWFGIFLPKIILNFIKKRRVKKFNMQLVDALVSLSSSLKAGFTIVQAFDLIAKEYSPPISQEIGLMLQEYRLGITLDQALGNLNKRINSDELKLITSATLIARSLGGNLAEIFDRLADTLRRRLKIEGKIRSLTAQGKMQGIVMSMLPLVLAFFLHLMNPTLMEPMFNSTVGYIALGAIVVMEGIGAYIIKKIVTIDM